MARTRRRVSRGTTAPRGWLDQRDDQMTAWTGTGLGLRPEGWWQYESGRPELAGPPGADVYAHLRDDPAFLEAPIARLRYLRDSRELTPAELAAIRAGAATEREPGRWAWRSRVLGERGGRP